MKSIPLQYAVYWLSKDGFLQCETWPFTLQFVAFWKSVGLWRNLGLTYNTIGSGLLRKECGEVSLF